MSISTTKWTRREILSSALKWAGSAAVVAPEFARAVPRPSGHYAPKLSVEGYIWTQYFGRQKETVAAGEEEALKDTHQAGYQRIELSDPFFKPALRNQTRDLLAEYQLRPESVYAGTTLHEAAAADTSIHDVLELADFLKPLGTRAIVTNPSPKPKGERKTDAELATQAANINRLGAALHQRGIRLLLHHHTPELADNARGMVVRTGPHRCHAGRLLRGRPLGLSRRPGRHALSAPCRNPGGGLAPAQLPTRRLDGGLRSRRR